MRGKVILKLGEGDTFVAESPIMLIKQMKLACWSRPNTLDEYMSRVQERVATVDIALGREEAFIYWDATSWLIGFAKAKNGVLIINGVYQ